MPAVSMRVELLAHTPEPLALVYAAFRQCYHPGYVGDMWPRLLAGEISPQVQADFVERILESGHASPIEHVSFTFAVEGVSRALTHQLVRHRMASYSQQSQRYVDASHFSYVMPPSVAARPEIRAKFAAFMDNVASMYRELMDDLSRNDAAKLRDDAAKLREDARFVLPQAAASNIVVTMNCRGLLNFFEHRCCSRAQWEIRALANAMLVQCRAVLPAVFRLAGARCERLGYCPEGDFCCGRYPVKNA